MVREKPAPVLREFLPVRELSGMPDGVDLAPLLAAPWERAKEVADEEIPAVLDTLAVHESRCALLRHLLTARLATPANHNRADDRDRWLTAREVAQRLSLSADYVYRHASRWPFAHRQGRTWRFDEQGLTRWMARRRWQRRCFIREERKA